jgi:indolepyruvate decarboxylase
MILAEVLLHALKDHGVQEIFGIPGDFVLDFFKVIEETEILPLYTLSHEPAVGFAADGAARCRCGPSVAAVTYGAGALNMVNAVACAYAEKSPVVVVSGGPGQGESHTGLLLHHQAKNLDSQFQIYREITCDQVHLDDPRQAGRKIARALGNCIAQSRPVYIEVARDQVWSPCERIESVAQPASYDEDAMDACVDELIERIREASSAVLMVGVEVRRYRLEQKVAQLARRLALPVVTSFMGRGLLAGTECPPIGTYMGAAGVPEVSQTIEHSDALLMLGVILSDTNIGISRQRIDLRNAIQALDGQVSMGHHVYPDIPMTALVDRMIERTTESHSFVCSTPTPRLTGLAADQQPVAPDDIARAINDLTAKTGPMPLATDVGDCLFTAMEIEHSQLVAPGYYATMGFGVPAGLGMQVALDRPIILVGDGAFQMTGFELGNCGRYGWDPIVLILNNCSWEMLRTFQPESKFNELNEWGFASMAAGMGGDGVRVHTRSQLRDALAEAQATRGRFQMIEIMIPRGEISSTMSRFSESLKKWRRDLNPPKSP